MFLFHLIHSVLNCINVGGFVDDKGVMSQCCTSFFVCTEAEPVRVFYFDQK